MMWEYDDSVLAVACMHRGDAHVLERVRGDLQVEIRKLRMTLDVIECWINELKEDDDGIGKRGHE